MSIEEGPHLHEDYSQLKEELAECQNDYEQAVDDEQYQLIRDQAKNVVRKLLTDLEDSDEREDILEIVDNLDIDRSELGVELLTEDEIEGGISFGRDDGPDDLFPSDDE